MTTDSSFTSDFSSHHILLHHDDLSPSYSFNDNTLTVKYATHRLSSLPRLVARYSPANVVLEDTLVHIESWCDFIVNLPPICLTCKIWDQLVTYSRSSTFVHVAVVLTGDDDEDEDFMEEMFNAITYTTWPSTWVFNFNCVGNVGLEKDLKKLARRIASQFLISDVKCMCSAE